MVRQRTQDCSAEARIHTDGTLGAAENARRAQEKSEKRPSKTMNIQELVDGPFIRFGTQSEIVLPFQERVAQEDSSRKGTVFSRIYAPILRRG